MPRISLETSHQLGQDEALRRLKLKYEAARRQFGSHARDLNEQWTDHTLDFSFTAMGMGVSGTVKVEDRGVKIDAQIPLAALVFKKAIEARIREELGNLLA